MFRKFQRGFKRKEQVDSLQQQISLKVSEIGDLNSQLSTKNTQIEELQDQVADYGANVTLFENQIANLSLQIQGLNATVEALEAPRLVDVSLSVYDNRTDELTPFLHITGIICNAGNKTAYNSVLRVFVQGDFQSTLNIPAGSGTIPRYGSAVFDNKIHYSGGAINMSSLTTTLEWTQTP